MHSYLYNRDTGNFEVVFRSAATVSAYAIRPFATEEAAAGYANFLNGGSGEGAHLFIAAIRATR